MNKPDLPDNEHERLAALYSTGILDTAAEDRFDRITRIALRLFDVPIALLSIVDDRRQWFKSCIGMTNGEIPREDSICAHAINGKGCLVIEDAAADPRFADNPLVTGEPGIRFYAGYPIRLEGGAGIGTLCVIDRAPRAFGAAEIDLLTDLGRIAEAELASIETAVTDPLTGLLNRRGFDLILRNNLLLSRRNRLASTLVYFDLENIQQVSDSHGKQQGDALLAEFADILRVTFRNSDVVARLGGDGFVVLLNDADGDQADHALAALHELVRGCNADREDGLALAYSHGAITFDLADDGGIDDMMARADRGVTADRLTLVGA